MARATHREIVAFFSERAAGAGLVDRLKIRYRPYVCPFDRLLDYADGHESVFDVGCGSGQFCSLLARFTDVKRIEGIEIDPRLVANARQLLGTLAGHGKDVRFNVYDGRDLPDVIADYALVTMIDVLHHIPSDSQRDILRQVFAKMRPGAVLVLKDIDASSPWVWFNKLHDLILAGAPGREWPLCKARSVCGEVGFIEEESFTLRTLVYPHFFLKLRKPGKDV